MINFKIASKDSFLYYDGYSKSYLLKCYSVESNRKYHFLVNDTLIDSLISLLEQECVIILKIQKGIVINCA